MLRITLPVARRAPARAGRRHRRAQDDMSETASDRLRLPVLPLKETVVFPESMTPLAVGQERSVKLIDDVVSGERMLALFTVENEEADPPGWDDLYRVGTVAVVHKMIKVPDGTLRILVQGVQRVRLVEPVQDEPYLVAELEDLPEVVPDSPEVEALTRTVQQQFAQIIGMTPYLPEELQLAAANVDDPTALTPPDRVDAAAEDRGAPGAARDGRRRGAAAPDRADPRPRGRDVGARLEDPVAGRERDRQGPARVLPPPAAEGDPGGARRGRRPAGRDQRAARADRGRRTCPSTSTRRLLRELNRLERLPPAAAEYGVIRTYLDWILTLPWNEVTEDNLDLEHARQILDEDHFDLEKVKERIIEYLAVSKLKNDLSGPILCFVGPPGVGKTSLGHSIARALGRKFARISVGGVRDESEIRGHRRTYIGAMPGTIIRAIRDAESSNPVFLIDEIDKMGADFRGDPASAMLEVLDPEQHSSFRDHYLDLPYDLSKVLFICTANTLDTIPGPLLDRMDVIQLSGYTHEEKLGIAKRYLVPKQIGAHGLKKSRIAIPDRTLRLVIAEYTREAGVRNLERQIAALCRKAATLVATGHTEKLKVDEERVREWLGARRFSADARRRTADPGVATGLAYTAVGGDVLFIEATAYAGTGKLTITGQLGEVMQESAQTALSWVRSRSDELGLAPEWFAGNDIHIHVPAGAVPKDGPSAGVTMATAIVSLVRGIPVDDDVGMTGEITLTGQVLPIGGIREKVLAAERAGLKRVILPLENAHDLDDLPPETRAELEFVLVDHVEEVFEDAFRGTTGKRRPQHATLHRQAAASRR